MRIGICDDGQLWCERAKKIVATYGLKHHLPMQIFVFLSEESLFEYEGRPLDVLFCDIDLNGSSEQKDFPEAIKAREKSSVIRGDGISLVRKVNHRWPRCQMIYVTNYLYYATEVYQTKHAFFTLKEQFEKRIEEIFETILYQLKQEQDRLLFSMVGGGQIILVPSDVYYFERNGRVTNIATKHGTYSVHEKLRDLLERLPEDVFIRCHNSYIVYLPAIREMVKGFFVLVDGTQIIISRSYAKKAKEAFMQWALTQFV
ncbi:MAG: LytTR family DNA-binding domain-containing protein [Oliverpabstia sp.]|nr:LytTR family DNA-binding domain-containing protein [Oliverpabstia sp.]